MKPSTRRRRSKGKWMRLHSTQLLADYMKAGDFSQARLARYVGCSRQFIHMLVNGERTTCTVDVGRRIEEAMRVLPGTLFAPSVSSEQKQNAKAGAAA